MWEGAFSSKRDNNKILSFQRSVTLLTTRALILTKLLTADLNAVEIAVIAFQVQIQCMRSILLHHRFGRSTRCGQLSRFSVSQVIELITIPDLTSHPTRDFGFSVPSIPGGGWVNFCPMDPNVYRFYLTGKKSDEKVGFSEVICNDGGYLKLFVVLSRKTTPLNGR